RRIVRTGSPVESARMTCIDVAEAGSLKPGRQSGAERLFHCPSPDHRDQHPSLSINPGKDKWMCGPCGPKAQGGPWTLAAHCAGVDPSDKRSVKAWLIEHGLSTNGNGTGRRIVAKYPYHDENGHVAFWVVRFDPKDFRQQRPDGTWNLDGVRRVLYRLPEVL